LIKVVYPALRWVADNDLEDVQAHIGMTFWQAWVIFDRAYFPLADIVYVES